MQEAVPQKCMTRWITINECGWDHFEGLCSVDVQACVAKRSRNREGLNEILEWKLME